MTNDERKAARARCDAHKASFITWDAEHRCQECDDITAALNELDAKGEQLHDQVELFNREHDRRVAAEAAQVRLTNAAIDLTKQLDAKDKEVESVQQQLDHADAIIHNRVLEVAEKDTEIERLHAFLFKNDHLHLAEIEQLKAELHHLQEPFDAN